MVGPYGDWVKHAVGPGASLVAESDGVRVVASTRHDMLRRVPDCLTDVFRIGSTAPGAPPRSPLLPALTPALPICPCDGWRARRRVAV